MDITSQVIQAINGWIQSLSASLLRPAVQAAGQLLFQTPAFDSIPQVQHTWALVRGLVDSLLVIAVLAAGLLVMASGTFETQYTAKRLIPRLVLAAVLSNASLAIVGALIQLDNALVTALVGSDPGGSAWVQLTARLESPAVPNQVVTSLIALAAAVLALLLVVVYIARDLLLVVGTVLAPLALAAHALPQLEELARLWWRGYLVALFMQAAQALLVSLGAQLVSHADWLGSSSSALVNGLVLITLLYLNLRLPFAAYQWAFRHPVSSHPVVRKVVVATKLAASAVA